ncbi:WecB/TagA/CpsF family glycosyltransferase [Burkholderia sp. BCC1644]|uniref:WecB/TagA/CpsF family glycosyltransferase n=1 Tax=Burkholderia sp. BCC1644 TaxID=2676293 RepID=UPI0015919E47|nr:WecB/TagA/CpsF family glycosyltransferase [Burkholderia sp. BCC1644]
MLNLTDSTRDGFAVRWIGALAACFTLVLLAVPLGMLVPFSRVERVTRIGRSGRRFGMWRLVSRDAGRHTLRARFGADHWLTLLNVACGQMAWVGPRALASTDDAPAGIGAQRLAVRPGLMCLWSLRLRTSIDYGTEWQADLEYLRDRGVRRDVGIVVRHALLTLITGAAGQHAMPDDVTIVDVRFDNLSMDDAIAQIRDRLGAGGPPAQVCFVNPACVNIAARHRRYRTILRRAALVLPDGIGIKIAGDLLATPLRQNVNGTDLFPRLCAALEGSGHGIFLLGGKPGVAQAMVERIAAQYPGLSIAGWRHGYFDTHDAAATRDVADAIRASGARLLLVAMGVPVQEQFIARHLAAFGVDVAMGVGGLFDFMSGATPRAPSWLRELGGEWLFRLAIEPGRMWKRYLIGNATFLARIALQHLGWRRRIVCRIVGADEFASPEPATRGGRRCVLFATRPAPDDFPVPADTPGALLPLGATTALERVLEHLAAAGCSRVDLVVSDAPALFRAIVGDGQRWGLDLHLHASASASHPYEWLHRIVAGAAGDTVLVGHAEVVPGAHVLSGLYERAALLVEPCDAEEPRWLGWAGARADALNQANLALDADALHRLLDRALPSQAARAGDFMRVDSIAGWMRAQASVLAAVASGKVPPQYRAEGWGGRGAQCRIAPDATIRGPVLIGERCLIGPGAEIGPNVVIGDDVIVATGTSLRDTTVLSGVYVGPGLVLDGAIAGQASLYSARWRAKLAFRSGDAVIAPLIAQPAQQGGGLAGRLAAAVVAAALSPFAYGVAAAGFSRVGARMWTHENVVVGWDAASAEWIERAIRVPRKGHGKIGGAVLSMFGNALDVAAGVRNWIGPRPRSAVQLAMLPHDWQMLLGARPPGWLNMPVLAAGIDTGLPDDALPPDDPLTSEIHAAADLYGIATRKPFQSLRLLASALRLKFA